MPRPQSKRIKFTTCLRTLREERFTSHEQAAHVCGINWKTYRSAEEDNEATEKVTEELEKVFGSLREPIRYNLSQVQAGSIVWALEVGERKPIQLDALAIDLVDGEKFIISAANALPNTAIHFRILVLVGPSSRLTCITTAPSKTVEIFVKLWSDNAYKNLDLLSTNLGGSFGPSDKTITVEIREYDRIPKLHGLRATTNGHRIYAWTRCYEDTALIPPRYDWGNDRYESERTSEKARPESQGAQEWEQLFESEWEKSKNVFQWPT